MYTETLTNTGPGEQHRFWKERGPITERWQPMWACGLVVTRKFTGGRETVTTNSLHPTDMNSRSVKQRHGSDWSGHHFLSFEPFVPELNVSSAIAYGRDYARLSVWFKNHWTNRNETDNLRAAGDHRPAENFNCTQLAITWLARGHPTGCDRVRLMVTSICIM
jgi:hypothetical protein